MKGPFPLSRILPNDTPWTPPLITLLGANIVTIVLAVVGNWDAAMVLFIYWVQSVIIGIFTVVSLLGADTAALASDISKSLKESGGSGTVSAHFVGFYKCLLAGFFALHYGLFHWGYFSFIVGSGVFGVVDYTSPDLWISCGIFLGNHLYSSLYHWHDTPRGGGFVTEEFFRPYHRIVPMHLTIIFGAMVMLALTFVGIPTTLPVLVLFLILKTYTDTGMHVRKYAGGTLASPRPEI